MNIIVYPPGAGGNLVSAVIDNKLYYYTGVHFETYRKKLRMKSYIDSMTDEDRDNYSRNEFKILICTKPYY